MYDVTMQRETPRLILRQPRLGDLERWAIGDFGMFSVLEKHSGESVGRLGSAKLRSATLPASFEGFAIEVRGQTRAQWQRQRAGLPLRETP